MFKSSTFDKTLETATSHLKLEPDWSSIMIICDLIRQNDVNSKYAVGQIKKKMVSQNPHTALYALMVLESAVKNCGQPIHEEIANRANCEAFAELVRTTTHENVRNKMLELIQTWSYAFRSAYKYRGIKDTMNILKTEGYKFPEMKDVSDKLFASDVAPDWADGDVCHRCRTAFSIVNRKHHCRNCGQVFCGQCSGKTSILPKYGIEKEVRVCDGCYDQLQKPVTAPAVATAVKKDEDELPVEYLNSSLAQQSQQPPRKTEEELREEEELQLALALSQSEIESKKQATFARRTYPKSPSPEPARRSPSPETPSDPELARYLNRNYWEQRQGGETTSPSAPSPMASSIISLNVQKSTSDQDAEIDEFVGTMRTQVEIFVNRMKSNSSRGRSIANDTSVQSLFMNITSMHSRLLTYIKEMDDKRQWHEQLQDKLAQVKDSRAALDVLRQEHIEKMRRIAEEQERQRQMQMAYKLEVMRKKKQEYLQYQRQLALQRIQEQEREMAMRQEQQKAQYMMGGPNYPTYIPPPGTQGSPMHANAGQQPQQYPGQYPGGNFANPQMNYGQMPPGMPQGYPQQQPNPQSAFMPINPAQNNSMQIPPGSMVPNMNGMNPQAPGMPMNHQNQANQPQQGPMMMPPGSQAPQQQQQPQGPMMMPPGSQVPPQQMPGIQNQNPMMPNQNFHQPQPQHPMQMNTMNQPPQQQQQQPPPQQAPPAPIPQQTAPIQQVAPVQQPPPPAAPKEPETAELISFD